MYAQVEKPKENKSRAVANSVTQKESNVKQIFGFVDNRPEAIAQRKQQDLVTSSPDGKQTVCNPSMVTQLAPIPQFGPPDTKNFYNANPSTMNQKFAGEKPRFGDRLATARLQHFAGGHPEGMIFIKSNLGYQSVKREFVQLDHDPSWSKRIKYLWEFPIGKSDDDMTKWVSYGYYKKAENGSFYPTVYAARMYYNDFDSLFPSSPGLNASGGAQSAGNVGHVSDSFYEEVIKEYVINSFGEMGASFLAGINIEDGASIKMILANIDAQIEKLIYLRSNIAGMKGTQQDEDAE